MKKRIKMYHLLVAGLFCLGSVARADSHVTNESDLWDAAPPTPHGLLEAIADSEPKQKLAIAEDAKEHQVEAALKSLNAKLRPKQNQHSELEVDPNFANSLNAKQKQGMSKLAEQYRNKINEGAVKVVKNPAGQLEPADPSGKHENRGRGHVPDDSSETVSNPQLSLDHAVGDGWWYWRTSYSWWGVKVYLNHNFLYYLCSFRTWMLSNSGLPSWIKTILGWIACGPHALDLGNDGATVYITYLGAFWYSP